MALKDQIFDLLDPAISQAGYFLEDVQVATPGKSRIITVIVDSDKPLNLDQVTVVSRQVGELLDNATFMGEQAFTLEVTSPGIDRPLTLERHWRKNIGKLVKVVKNSDGIVEGRILSVTSNSAILENAEINFADVRKATLVIEFKK